MKKKQNAQTAIKFTENEYISIRTELIERIKLLNSQSFTVLATVVSFWAIGLTFKVQILAKLSALSVTQQVFIDFLSTIIFLIPIFLFIPLSSKSGENLLQIASLSAYIKVFFDYPVEIGKINTNWETSNNMVSDSNVNRYKRKHNMNLYNEDYTILAIISLVIYIIFVILQVDKLYLQGNKIKTLYIILTLLIYLFVTIISILSIVFIHKTSSIKNTLMKGTIYYTQAYIKRANELGIISNDNIKKAINELNPLRKLIVPDYFKHTSKHQNHKKNT